MESKIKENAITDSEVLAQDEKKQDVDSVVHAEVVESATDDVSCLRVDLDRELHEDCHYNDMAKSAIVESIRLGVGLEPQEFYYYYSKVLNVLVRSETPFESVQSALKLLSNLNIVKRCFLIDKVLSYISPCQTEWDDWDCRFQREVHSLLKAEYDRIRPSKKPIQDVRRELAILIQQEFKDLPERIKNLDDKERVGFLCKMMPYIMQRAESDSWMNTDFDFL